MMTVLPPLRSHLRLKGGCSYGVHWGLLAPAAMVPGTRLPRVLANL